MSAKEIIQRVLKGMAKSKLQTFTVSQGQYWLQVAIGRPGSICFTLQEEVGPSVKVILAEGFTLGDSIIYDQRTLPVSFIEEVVSELVDNRFQTDRRIDTVDIIPPTLVADA